MQFVVFEAFVSAYLLPIALAVFNAEKLFNRAQVALTKIPRNEDKTTKNGFSAL